MLNNFNPTDYMRPEFDITIDKAYANFYYSFSIFVDPMGRMFYGKPLRVFFEETQRVSNTHLSKAVMETYLKFYLDVKPGSTLGIAHTSEIAVNVTGKSGL